MPVVGLPPASIRPIFFVLVRSHRRVIPVPHQVAQNQVLRQPRPDALPAVIRPIPVLIRLSRRRHIREPRRLRHPVRLDPEHGTPVWLEINPQGQFLFLEGMCGELPLTRIFADFLLREAERAAPTFVS